MAQSNVWVDGMAAAFRPYFDTMPQWQTEGWIKLAIKHLHLSKDTRLLDCPCGIGRLCIPLARQGIEIVGVDISPDYIDELNRKAGAESLPIQTKLADMRNLPFENEFDAAMNLFTSIGYFEDDVENQKVIDSAYRALKPGGRFLLDTVNRDWLAKNFTSSNWENRGEFRLLQRRTFDFERSIETCHWTFIRGKKEHVYCVPLRWYSLHELVGMFRAAGFVDIEHFGDFDEEPVDFNTRRLFVIGRKPS